MARILDESILPEAETEITLMNYGTTVTQIFGFKQIKTFSEMRTLTLTTPDNLRSKFSRFGEVLEFLDLNVFHHASVAVDDLNHIIFVTDSVYDQMNLKVKNGLDRLRRKGISYHWVLIGEPSNVTTPGETYLIQDYPSLTDNYDVIDEIIRNIALGKYSFIAICHMYSCLEVARYLFHLHIL